MFCIIINIVKMCTLSHLLYNIYISYFCINFTFIEFNMSEENK